jgi:hypothetical protein
MLNFTFTPTVDSAGTQFSKYVELTATPAFGGIAKRMYKMAGTDRNSFLLYVYVRTYVRPPLYRWSTFLCEVMNLF